MKRDADALFTQQQIGDFLPCLAPVALFADEFHEGFKPTVEGSSTAWFRSLHCLHVAHSCRIVHRNSIARRASIALAGSGRVKQNSGGVYASSVFVPA